MNEPINPLPTFGFSPRYLSSDSAWVSHLPFAYDLVRVLKPATVIELGTWLGDSFFTLCQSVVDHHLPTVCYAVDSWQGDSQAGGSGDRQYHQVASYQSEHYRKCSYLVRSDFDTAATQFEDEIADLIHIDGYHSYEAVCNDFEKWFPKLKKGGIILFHDTCVRSSASKQDFGVWKFWSEIKSQYKTYEFTSGYGLGILLNDVDSELEAWIAAATEGEWLQYYHQKGMDLTQIANLRKSVKASEGRESQMKGELNVALQSIENLRQEHENARTENDKLLKQAQERHQEAEAYGETLAHQLKQMERGLEELGAKVEDSILLHAASTQQVKKLTQEKRHLEEYARQLNEVIQSLKASKEKLQMYKKEGSYYKSLYKKYRDGVHSYNRSYLKRIFHKLRVKE